MNWSFIANLKLIWCVMNPLCWLARVWKLMVAVMCVYACGVCTRAGLRADVCGLARRFCGSQMGWICRVGTEGLAETQAISPTSIITHNYTLNGLKNRVTTNQPGSHGGRENEVSFMALFTYKGLCRFGAFCFQYQLLSSSCASMTPSSAHRGVFTSDVTQLNRSGPHPPLRIPQTWFDSLTPVSRWEQQLVLIYQTKLANTGQVRWRWPFYSIWGTRKACSTGS